MKRVKTPQSQGRDYSKMLKDYFSFHLSGLEVKEEGGQIQVQLVYEDFKHIDTVRKELAQMMPEVEFTKLRRDFSNSAIHWAFEQMMYDERRHPAPVIYVKKGESIVPSNLYDIAITELRQLELEDDDDIHYTENEMKLPDDEKLAELSWD